MVKIKIKPKTVAELEVVDERQREIQDAYCEEIRNLRCEMEMMKVAMDEMKRRMNEMHMQMQMQLQNGYSYHSTRCGCAVDADAACTGNDLETMFESKDVIDWASKFIVADLKQRSGNPYAICSIKGSRNELIVCDKKVWKKLTDEEFMTIIVNKIFKKLLAAFTAWKNENYNRILTSEHFSTLYHSNYARILSFNENASKLKMKLFHML